MAIRTSLHHTISLPEYIRQKLNMLKKDFMIRLSQHEIEHMMALTTEIAVDNYAKKLIYKRL
jgi:hypothetical protein